MTWIINADMLATMQAINLALLRPNCRAASRGDSIEDSLAVFDRAQGCWHLKISESTPLLSCRHDFALLAGRCSGKAILGVGGVRYGKTRGDFGWRRQRWGRQ